MSTATVPSSNVSRHRVSTITLVIGAVVSLLVHLGVGVEAGRYFGSASHGLDSSGRAIEMDPAVSAMPKPDEVHLGAQDATRASINWLGVVEEPEVGDAPVAEVEQAAFTKQVGDGAVAVSPTPEVEPMERVEEAVVEPIREPIREVVDVQEPIVEQKPEPVEEVVEEPVEEVVEEAAEPTPEQVELVVEPEESATVVIEAQPEAVDEPAESTAQELVEESVEKPVEKPVEEVVEASDSQPVDPADEVRPAAKPAASSEAVSPQTAGKAGVVSEKESAASIIKRAIKVDASKLNKPIVGKGLEIITVEPKFPASVRFTEMPRNPVLMIRFNASGRVSKAYFFKEGRRVYDTGVVGVDEPLMSAVYQWRAKGKQIDALDPRDPKSVVEISMRIVFHKEGKKKKP
jgi:hypothetical protein